MAYQDDLMNLATAQAGYKALTEAKGHLDAATDALAQAQARASIALQEAQAAIGQAGVTVGLKSSVTTRAEAERTQGQSAAIDVIKADPAISEASAIAAWRAGVVLPSGRTIPLHDPGGLLEEYAANAHAAGAIPDTSWQAFRAFIVATDKQVLMGM